MTRFFAILACATLVASCGDGNPFEFTQTDGGDDAPGSRYASGDGAVMNNIKKDGDAIVLNNLPHDDSKGRYTEMAGVDLGNDFKAYESNPATDGNDGSMHYFAVFRRSDSGHSQVAAAATGDYADYGNFGAGAQRLNDRTTLPADGNYVYTGDYAAVQITKGHNGSNDARLISGDVRLQIDFDDHGTGVVGGTINNRQLFDTQGNLIGIVGDVITLADTEIDHDNAILKDGTAISINSSDATITHSGEWGGTFAGPDGEEVAGFVVLENTDDDTQESGVFITTR